MAKKVIANLNIQVGATSTKVKRVFGQIGKDVHKMAGDVGQVNAKMSRLTGVAERAERGLANFGRRIKGLVISFGLMVTAAASAALSVRGLVSSFANVDKLAKWADKLGETTERLAGFQFAAEQTGVDANAAAVALQRMTRRVATAAQGGGEAKKSLEELGLSAAKLAQMAPTQAFGEVAQAMGHVTNAGDRVRLAFSLFDSEGVALVNTLALGKQGLADMQAEAERLGLTIDRESARKVEAANDAIHKMQMAAQGLANTLAVTLGPAVTRLAGMLTEFVVWVKNLDQGTIKAALQIGGFAASFGLAIAVVPKAIAAIRAVIVTLKALTTASVLAQGATGVGLVKALAGLAIAGGVAVGVGQAFDKLTAGTEAAASTLKPGGPISDYADELERAKTAAEETKKATEEARREAERWAGIGQRITDEFATPAEKMHDRLAEIKEALGRGVIDLETYRRAVAGVADAYLEAEEGGRRMAGGAGPQPVAAVSRGTSAAQSAIHASRSAYRKMQDHLAKLRETADRRDRLLAEISDRTDRVGLAVVDSKPTVVKHRI